MTININVKDYKSFVNNLNEDEIDVIGDDYTSCWMFSYYVHTKYGLPIQNYEAFYEEEQNSEFNLNKNGIYSYFMSHNTEMHHFILFVNNDNLTLMSTYGGQKNIIEIKYNKNDFINFFEDLINEIDNDKKIKKYYKLFGINKICFDILDISNLTLSYTFKEYNDF